MNICVYIFKKSLIIPLPKDCQHPIFVLSWKQAYTILEMTYRFSICSLFITAALRGQSIFSMETASESLALCQVHRVGKWEEPGFVLEFLTSK